MAMLHHRSCNICEAMCGLIIEHDGREVLSIKPDPADPLSRGHICPKAIALQDFRSDPDRITAPLRKTADGWETISYEEAFAFAVERIKAVQGAHGADGMGVYLGNPNAHKLGNLLNIPSLVKALGSKNRYSSATADQIPHHVASIHMFGHPMLIPVPDLERTDFLLIIGGNPIVSNGSMMTAPDFPNRMKEIQARGGRVVVIDPRRTETAKRADAHHFIRPETDAWLLLAMIGEVFSRGLADLGHLAGLTEGLDDLRAAVAPFTPERAAERTGLSADVVRELAGAFASAERAVCYSRMGASTQSFGGLCQWATNALNIVTGNFDRAGGAMFTTPAFDYVGMTSRKGRDRLYPERRSRVSGLPLYNGEFPVAVMAEEMETPGEGQIRGLITIAGNPVLTAPNGRRIERALPGLDFMMSIDLHINDTTRHADLILPATVALEEAIYDMVFHAFAVRNTAGFAEALFEPPAGVMPEWEVIARLAAALNGADAIGPSPTEVLAQMLGRGFHPHAASFEVLSAAQGAIDLGPLAPSLTDRLETSDGRLHLAPDAMLADLPRLMADTPDTDHPFVLIGRRQTRSHNSWTQNAHRLVKGRSRCTMQMNPGDAARLGVEDGSMVAVSSRTGRTEIAAEVTDDMAPGVVSIPQGWGQARGRIGTATVTPTVSINDVTDDARVDLLTGNAALNGVPVSIAPVARA
ncbi:MAG: molybdopterin-dependent oxidoreductase [Caulobacterales bacterium]|nr:molybdopterin-dependent oxidoreductase [Caulobacterales bacterium]